MDWMKLLANVGPHAVTLVVGLLGGGVLGIILGPGAQDRASKNKEKREETRRRNEKRRDLVQEWNEGIAASRADYEATFVPGLSMPKSLPFIRDPWFASLQRYVDKEVLREIHKETAKHPFLINGHLDNLQEAANAQADEWGVD
ncbi:hypothetical protein [Janibacter melonis]|uniref:hypothetical protein n=1 Tax=Janibacter melonis TaxID=262209 RepID=UPI0019187CDF|nr:hypothetical protein [Janibacter melonis]